MNFKLEKYDYPSLALKYISNKELANQIQTNIDFVEKYLDCIETMFPAGIDQRLMYKQLGIIAFSCTEALWKSLVFEVNKKCHDMNCEKNCCYRQFDSIAMLNKAKIRDIIDHLQNMRLIYIAPWEMLAIEELQQLRNHVHLTSSIIDGYQLEKFNKKYVENMLRLYYVTLNQMELNDWHLNNRDSCLKILDEDGYNRTKKTEELERKRYISDAISYMTSDLFHDKQISEEHKKFLKNYLIKKHTMKML